MTLNSLLGEKLGRVNTVSCTSFLHCKSPVLSFCRPSNLVDGGASHFLAVVGDPEAEEAVLHDDFEDKLKEAIDGASQKR